MLWYVLWPKIWSTMVNVSCEVEKKNVYSTVCGWVSLWMLIISVQVADGAIEVNWSY